LQEVASLSSLVSLEYTEHAERKPSFAINRKGAAMSIHFAGIPMGHEFTSFVLALLQAGGYPPKVDDSVIEQIRALDGELRFETFISLSCQNCPDRKSTRLNSSHVKISYAVFCLKKKKRI